MTKCQNWDQYLTHVANNTTHNIQELCVVGIEHQFRPENLFEVFKVHSLPRLKHLTINIQDWARDKYVLLALTKNELKFPKLESLVILCSVFDGRLAQPLHMSEFKELCELDLRMVTGLNISGIRFGDAGVKNLTKIKLQNLRWFDVYNNGISANAVQDLKQIYAPQLARLYLQHGNDVTAQQEQEVQEAIRANGPPVKLSNGHVECIGWRQYATSLSTQSSLTITHMTLTGKSPFETPTNQQHYTNTITSLHATTATQPQPVTELTEITEITETTTAAHLRSSSPPRNGEECHFRTQTTAKTVSTHSAPPSATPHPAFNTPALPNLTHLTIIITHWPSDHPTLHALAANTTLLPALTSLSLTCTHYHEHTTTPLTHHDITQLARIRLPHLTLLSLNNHGMDDVDARTLATMHLPHVRELRLNGNRIKQDGVAALARASAPCAERVVLRGVVGDDGERERWVERCLQMADIGRPCRGELEQPHTKPLFDYNDKYHQNAPQYGHQPQDEAVAPSQAVECFASCSDHYDARHSVNYSDVQGSCSRTCKVSLHGHEQKTWSCPQGTGTYVVDNCRIVDNGDAGCQGLAVTRGSIGHRDGDSLDSDGLSQDVHAVMLGRAIVQNDFEWFNWLLTQGIDLNVADSAQQYTPLMMSAMYDRGTFVDVLLQAGKCNVLAVNAAGDQAVHIAARHESVCVLKKLQNQINSQNSNNESPIMVAARHGQRRSVQFLVENGSDFSLFNKQYETALHAALKNKKYDICKYLIQKGIDVEQLNVCGQSGLMLLMHG